MTLKEKSEHYQRLSILATKYPNLSNSLLYVDWATQRLGDDGPDHFFMLIKAFSQLVDKGCQKNPKTNS